MKSYTIRLVLLSTLFYFAGPFLWAQQSVSGGDMSLAYQHQNKISEKAVALLEEQIELNLEYVTLETALTVIAEKAQLKLMYSEIILPKDKRVTVHHEAIPLYNALWEVLDGTGIRFAISPNRQLVLMRDEEIAEVQTEPVVDQVISGRVTDAGSGEPLVGVTVMVPNTTIGTTTNSDGVYTLSVPESYNTLVFSYIGFRTVEVSIGERELINIALEQDLLLLEDLIVVGYGVQQRVNLTGAVDQVTSEQLERRPVANLTQGLQGLMPNVNIDPGQGKPIESPAINIRGVTSIGQGGNALVLIDGVEGDPSMLNPNDVASVSVLKDASAAAVYGARGAFGVVLIETKQGARNDFSVNYSTNFGFKQPTVNQGDFEVDPGIWATKYVEAFQNWEGTFPRNVNKTLPFSPEYYQEILRRANDPSLPRTWVADDGTYRYAHANNWYDELYTDVIGSVEHNLSISRGTQNSQFVISGRYQAQDGLFRHSPDDYRLMNLRARASADVTSWLIVSNNFNYSNRTYFNPLTVGEGGNIWRNIADEGHPLAPMYNPDGTLTHSAVYTVGNHVYDSGGFNFERNVLRNTSGMEARFLQNRLRVVSDFSIQRTQDEESRYRFEIPYSDGPDRFRVLRTEFNDLRVTEDKRNYLATNFYVQFEDTFASKHNLRSMVGYNYEESESRRLRAFRDGLIFKGADDLNLALGSNVDTGGGYEKWAIQGGFYRFNYIYDERYLVELSGRYDGSTKFPENERYAFFPSASVGWRISSESFFRVPQNIINHLQLRASYGSMGNGNINSYVFLETFNITQTTSVLNGERPRRTSNPSVLPDGLTWETSTTSNLGLDLEMFESRFSFTGDVYLRETSDMFTIALTPPAVFGASAPRGNYADLETKGWEMQMNWRDQFQLGSKPFNYRIGLSMSDSKSTITRYNNPDRFLNDYYEGMVIGEFWGYVTDGFFVDQADIASHADQSRFRSTSWGEIFPGDLKLRDLNGDGVIGPGDNTVDNPGDRKIIGNTSPRYRIGINLGAEWNNLFVSAFFQGVLRQNWYPRHDSALFWGMYNRPYGDLPKWHLREGVIWTEENPSQDAFFPRFVGRLANRDGAIMRSAPQTQYLMDMKYIRMKNIQIGYNLPMDLTSKIGVRSATVYVSGENLWTWAPFYKTVTNMDVENALNPSDPLIGGNAGDGYNYPMLKSVNLGLSVTF
ncbi:MAG: TonB-dependent receptor [Balneolaceae bacterium]|nr:MAG: TonB-dependent receptor [Balneolaceae bacterium]